MSALFVFGTLTTLLLAPFVYDLWLDRRAEQHHRRRLLLLERAAQLPPGDPERKRLFNEAFNDHSR